MSRPALTPHHAFGTVLLSGFELWAMSMFFTAPCMGMSHGLLPGAGSCGQGQQWRGGWSSHGEVLPHDASITRKTFYEKKKKKNRFVSSGCLAHTCTPVPRPWLLSRNKGGIPDPHGSPLQGAGREVAVEGPLDIWSSRCWEITRGQSLLCEKRASDVAGRLQISLWKCSYCRVTLCCSWHLPIFWGCFSHFLALAAA